MKFPKHKGRNTLIISSPNPVKGLVEAHLNHALVITVLDNSGKSSKRHQTINLLIKQIMGITVI